MIAVCKFPISVSNESNLSISSRGIAEHCACRPAASLGHVVPKSFRHREAVHILRPPTRDDIAIMHSAGGAQRAQWGISSIASAQLHHVNDGVVESHRRCVASCPSSHRYD